MKRSKFEEKAAQLINKADDRDCDYLDGTMPITEAGVRRLAKKFADKVTEWGVIWDAEESK